MSCEHAGRGDAGHESARARKFKALSAKIAGCAQQCVRALTCLSTLTLAKDAMSAMMSLLREYLKGTKS